MSVCDICGNTMNWDEMYVVPLAKVKELIQTGYVPSRHPREWDDLAQDPNMQNLLLQSPDGSSLDMDLSRPGAAVKAFWILTVANATDDFAVCIKCNNDISDHKSRLSKKLEKEAEANKAILKGLVIVAIVVGFCLAGWWLLSREDMVSTTELLAPPAAVELNE